MGKTDSVSVPYGLTRRRKLLHKIKWTKILEDIEQANTQDEG